MPTHIATGFSQNPDPVTAYKEAAIEAKTKLNLTTTNLLMVFFTPGYLAAAGMQTAQKILRPEKTLGTIAPCLILSDRTEPRGVALLSISSDEINFGLASVEKIQDTPLNESGIWLGKRTAADIKTSKRQAILYFIDGAEINNSLFFRGLQEALGLSFPIIGAAGCESPDRCASVHCCQDLILEQSAVGLLIGGQFSLGISSRHGWRPLGKPRIITESSGNLIRRINHKPAISLYEDYFKDNLALLKKGTLGDIALLYPLGIIRDRPKEYILRHPVKALPDGTLLMQGDVPANTRVHLMIADKDACLNAARESALEVREQLRGKSPKLLVIFSSIARRKVMGRSAFSEIHMIKEILGLTVPVIGMYTYGEIAPLEFLKNTQRIEVQNSNMIVLALA
jgi:hypothetical protein